MPQSTLPETPAELLPPRPSLLPGLLAAVPDLAIAVVFLVTWIEPTALGPRMVRQLMLVMLVEFIVVHSAGIMGAALFDDGPRRKKLKALVGFGCMYSLFMVGFVVAFEQWWPLWTLWGLTLNKFVIVLLGRAPTGMQRQRMQAGWAAACLWYVVFAGVTTMAPVPELGITRAVRSGLDLPGSGLWVSEPHRVVAFGFLYFAALGASMLFIDRRARARAGACARPAAEGA